MDRADLRLRAVRPARMASVLAGQQAEPSRTNRFLIVDLNNFASFPTFAIGLLVAGIILLSLGYWANQTGNKMPFWIGIGFCVLNILITIASGSASGIIISAILIYYLYRGTKSEAPEPKRKPFNDPNAPLDSNL